MRDIFFITTFGYLLFQAIRHPSVAASIWLWVSMVAPKEILYGFAANLRYNVVIALISFASMMIHRDKIKGYSDAITFMIILFFCHATLTSIFAEYSGSLIYKAWDKLFKIMLLYFVAVAVLNNRRQLEMFLLAMVIGLAMFGVIEGAKFVSSGGGHRVAVGFMGDNNMLALALCMAMPIISYFQVNVEEWYYRWACSGLLLCFALAVMATGSRGGFVGMVVLLIMNFFFAKRKLGLGIAYVIGICVAVYLTQDHYVDRLSTIEGAEQSDASFMGRLVAWKVAFLLALEHPFMGVGFYGLQNHTLFFGQAENYHLVEWIPAPDLSFVDGAKAAHSIYFQVLSDHGFLGFAIYFLMIGVAMLKAISIMHSRLTPYWMKQLMKYVLVSFVVFLLSGAALSFAYNDITFALLAVVTAAAKIKNLEKKQLKHRH